MLYGGFWDGTDITDFELTLGINDDIQYDYLFNQTGGLHFKKLSRRKKYENRNN